MDNPIEETYSQQALASRHPEFAQALAKFNHGTIEGHKMNKWAAVIGGILGAIAPLMAHVAFEKKTPLSWIEIFVLAPLSGLITGLLAAAGVSWGNEEKVKKDADELQKMEKRFLVEELNESKKASLNKSNLQASDIQTIADSPSKSHTSGLKAPAISHTAQLDENLANASSIPSF